jgi:mono/diheme cytochrome c family protein
MPKSSLSKRGVAAIGVGAALVLAALVYVAIGDGSSGGGADPEDAGQVALGKRVYGEQCAACHGDRLQGQPNWKTPLPAGGLPAPPHDASGHTWHHPDQVLFDVTRYGGGKFAPPGFKSNMPGFEDAIENADIWAVLAYIKKSWPTEIRDRQAAINRRSREAR